MKNFGRIFTLAALCAVILGSCIKEQAYKLETAQLMVNISRAGASESQTQGDGIGDAMVWAFKCNLDSNGVPSNVENTATGWRHQSNINTFESMSVHVELPLCDGEAQAYLIAVVMNTDKWGNVSKPFGANTSYSDLMSATFNATSADFWGTFPDDVNLDPSHLPVSNWATINVTNENIHSDNPDQAKCYQLDLPVYRAVAKTQLYMAKSSNDYTLEVVGARVLSDMPPTAGFVMTKQSLYASAHAGKPEQLPVGTTKGYPNQVDGLAGLDIPYDFMAGERAMWNTTTGDVASFTAKSITALMADNAFDFVASTFLYENGNAVVTADENWGEPADTGNGGYYMEITYRTQAGSNAAETHTRYVPLPQVVRNHDYQIKATVDQAVNGELVVNYIVTEWETKTIDVPPFN